MRDVESIIYTSYSVSLFTAAPLVVDLTPEFLRINNVVPDFSSAESETPAGVGALQRYRFEDGPLVHVRPDRIYFEWEIFVGEEPWSKVIRCNETIGAFLAIPSFVAIDTLAIELRGYTVMPDDSLGVFNLGEQLEDIHPVVAFRANYDLEFRDVQFEIEEDALEGSEFIDGLRFRYMTKYYFSEDVSGEDNWDSIVDGDEDWV